MGTLKANRALWKYFVLYFCPLFILLQQWRGENSQIIKQHLCWEVRWMVSSGKYLPKQEYYITHANCRHNMLDLHICAYRESQSFPPAPGTAIFHPWESIPQLDSTASEQPRKNPTLTSCWAKNKAPNMWMDSSQLWVMGWVISNVTVSSASRERLMSPGGGWAGEQPQHLPAVPFLPSKANPPPASVSQLNKGDQHHSASHIGILRGKGVTTVLSMLSMNITSICH